MFSQKAIRCIVLMLYWLSSFAYSQNYLLLSPAVQSKGNELISSVATEHGSVYVLSKESDGSFSVHSRESSSPGIQLESGAVVSGLVALNNGTKKSDGDVTDTLALFVFVPGDGHRLYRFEFKGAGVVSSVVYFKDAIDSRCSDVDELSLSAGLRNRIFFVSNCIIGEFDFTAVLGRLVWSERNLDKIYSGIAPAVDSRGRAHFLVQSQNSETLQVLRSKMTWSYETLVSFGLLSASSKDSPPFSGMVILADGSVLLTGSKNRKIERGRVEDLELDGLTPWGTSNFVTTDKAFYFAGIDADFNLAVRKFPYSPSELVRTYTKGPISVDSKAAPGSVSLVQESELKLVYYDNQTFFKQSLGDMDSSPEQVSISTFENDTLAQSILSPVVPLMAGSDAYIKGETILQSGVSQQVYKMVTGRGASPFSGANRGYWSQFGADQQHTSSVVAGVEVVLDESASLVALSCYSVGEPDDDFLIPTYGFSLREGSRLLSLYHHELTQSENLTKLKAGVTCRPYAVIAEDEFDIDGSGEAVSIGASLGDSFRLQLISSEPQVDGETVPLWGTDRENINSALSSQLSEATGRCHDGRESCSGYRRLVIGGDASQAGNDYTPYILAGAGFGGLTAMCIILLCLIQSSR